MITKVIKSHPFVFVVVFYALLSLVAFRNFLFTPGTIGLKDDWSIPPFAAQNIEQANRVLYTWWSGGLLNRNLGEYLGLVLGVLSKIFNLDGEVFSKAIPVLSIFFSGLFFFWLAKSYRVRPLASLLGGLIYMFTPITFNSVVSGYTLFLISYALLPLYFLCYKRLIGNSKINLNLIVFTAIILRLIIGQDNFIMLVAIFSGSYFVYREVTDWLGWRHCAKDTIAVGLMCFIAVLLSAPFVIDFIANIGQNVNQVLVGRISWNTYLTPTLSKALFQDGAGYRYFFSSIDRDIYPLWFFISAILLTCYLSSLFFIGGYKKMEVPFFGLLVIIALFIFKGVHPPLGMINMFLADKLPLFTAAFRNSQYVTVLSSLAYAALACFFVNYILSQISNEKVRNVMAVLFFVLWSIAIYPFYTGDFNKYVQSYKLDEHYALLDKNLRSDDLESRVLLLPPSQPMSYKGSVHAGLDPINFGLTKTAITNDGSNELEKMLVTHLYLDENSRELETSLAFLNVGKVVFRTDFESRHLDYMGPEWIRYKPIWNNVTLRNQIDNMSFLEETEKFGQAITVYSNKTFFPMFYIPGSITVTGGPLETLLAENPTNGQGDPKAVYFTWQNPSGEIPPLLSTWQKSRPAPTVEYAKVNPTEYKLVVHKASSSFPLVFSEIYNSGWTLFPDSESLLTAKKSKFPISANFFGTVQNDNLARPGFISRLTRSRAVEGIDHFKINGFANGWIIDPIKMCQDGVSCQKEADGSFDLSFSVGFISQKYHLIGLLISGTTFVLCLVLLVNSVLKLKKTFKETNIVEKADSEYSGPGLPFASVIEFIKFFPEERKRVIAIIIGLFVFNSVFNSTTMPLGISIINWSFLGLIFVSIGVISKIMRLFMESLRTVRRKMEEKIYLEKRLIFIAIALCVWIAGYNILTFEQLFFLIYILSVLILGTSPNLTIWFGLIPLVLMSFFPFSGQTYTADQLAIFAYMFLALTVVQLILENIKKNTLKIS